MNNEIKKIEAKRNAALAKAAPLHKQREAILKKMRPLETQLRKVEAEIDKTEAPLREYGNQIAALARGAGAITLKNEP